MKIHARSLRSILCELLLFSLVATVGSVSLSAQEEGLPLPNTKAVKRSHLVDKWRKAFDAEQAVENTNGHTIAKEDLEKLKNTAAQKKKEALECEKKLQVGPTDANSWAKSEAEAARKKAKKIRDKQPKPTPKEEEEAKKLEAWAKFLESQPHLY